MRKIGFKDLKSIARFQPTSQTNTTNEVKQKRKKKKILFNQINGIIRRKTKLDYYLQIYTLYSLKLLFKGKKKNLIKFENIFFLINQKIYTIICIIKKYTTEMHHESFFILHKLCILLVNAVCMYFILIEYFCLYLCLEKLRFLK